MKYWRGYLVAAIIGACSWGLIEFAQSHWALVDMIYPYMTRMVQDYLATWSSGVDFCLWQLLLIVTGVVLLATIVMMILWKWNPIQWLGWVLAAASVVFFLNTAIWGLNDYAGPIAQDLRLEVSDYQISELEEAAAFYQQRANTLAASVPRDADGNVKLTDLNTLSQRAAEGFQKQTQDHYRPIFAGSTLPVKELSWSNICSSYGITGLTVGITGEAAVNMQTPSVSIPFVVCRQMAQRMCITDDQDATFAAFLACDASPYVEFQYAAYFMAYRYCQSALLSMDTALAQQAAMKLNGLESDQLRADMVSYGASFAVKSDSRYISAVPNTTPDGPQRSSMVDLLVNWHIQEYVLPLLKDDVILFDPTDESMVDLSGLPHT